MKGRAHPGIGVHRIDNAKKLRQNIVPGKYIRAQILPVWENAIDRHGNDLGDDDIRLHLLKAVYAVQQEIQQRSYDQKVPAHVGNNKPFTEGHHIIQPGMDRIAVFCGNQILCQHIQCQITDPAKKQFQMAEFGGC